MWRYRDIDGKYKLASPTIMNIEPEEIRVVREYLDREL